MKKIGILCASDTELAPFLPNIEHLTFTEKAMLRFYEGTIGGIPVVAAYSGVCKVNAAIAAQLFIDVFQADIIINAGTAGGIDETVNLFDTVVAESTAYHDVADDILTEFHPWMESVYFQADKKLLELARVCSQKFPGVVRFGTIVTGESFIEDDGRGEISRRFSPLAVDMESAAVSHVCYVNQIPFLAVRTITDTVSHMGIEHFEENCEKASDISAAFVIRLLQMV